MLGTTLKCLKFEPNFSQDYTVFENLISLLKNATMMIATNLMEMTAKK